MRDTALASCRMLLLRWNGDAVALRGARPKSTLRPQLTVDVSRRNDRLATHNGRAAVAPSKLKAADPVRV